jgi:hypothetical protein
MDDDCLSSRKSLVPVFSGTGFGQWRHRMANYLLQNDYEDVVGFDLDTLQPGATAPILKTDGNDTATHANTKKDRKAKAMIEHRLDDSILAMVSSSRTSYEIWKSLHEKFQRKTMAAVVTALRTLVETTKMPSETMQSYISRIQSNCRALADTGMTMDLLPVTMLLSNVGEEYAATTTALDTLDAVSMTKASAMLLNAELSASPPAVTAAQAEIIELRQQIAALTAKAPSKRTAFKGKPCNHHGPRSTHTSEECYVLHPELLTNKQAPSLYAVSGRSGLPIDDDTNWYIDSGAGRHMDNDAMGMKNFRNCKGPMIQLGNNDTIESIGVGSSFIKLNSRAIEVHDVLYVKDLGKKLLSTGQSTAKGIKFWFDGDRCTLFDKEGCTPPSGTIIGTSIKTRDNMYPLPSLYVHPKTTNAAYAKRHSDAVTWTTWHKRLGHLNHRDMLRLQSDSAQSMPVLGKTEKLSMETCEHCIMGKMTRFPFSASSTVTTRPGELVFTDLEGPFPVSSIKSNSKYYVSYYDHFTKRPFVYLLRKKSDQLAALKQFNSEVFQTSGKNINRLQTLQSDNAGEYTSNDCKLFYQQMGIHHQTIVAYDSESNGSPERLNRTIMEMEGCMRSNANLGPEFWEFTVGLAVYLLTRRPHSALPNRITPFEAWYGRKPSITHYRVPGCDAWYHIPKVHRKKLQFKGQPAIFIGYSTNQKAYKLWNPFTKQVVISRTVIFDESAFNLARSPKRNQKAWPTEKRVQFSNRIEIEEDDRSEDETRNLQEGKADQGGDDDDKLREQEVENPSMHERRHSTRTRAPIDRYVPVRAVKARIDMVNDKELPRPDLSRLQAADIPVPKTLEDAIKGPFAGHWLDSARSELAMLNRFGTLQLTNLPEDRKAIGSKFVFKVKSKADGTIDKFKSRLCGKGYSQRPGFDFNETFSPVAHAESIRVILALAAEHQLHLHQVDIVGAFLNGTLEEEIYMRQPEGGIEPGKEDMVYMLMKALYGLKQSGRVWNKRFDKFITEKQHFVRLKADPCVYVKTSDSSFLLLGLHVDDIIMSHNDLSLSQDVIKALSSEFEITDLGLPVRLLGMRISRSSPTGSISIDQTAYVEETLKRFDMSHCKPETIPHQPNFHFSKAMSPSTTEENESMKDLPFNDLLGSLLWIALHTRPDLAQSVGVLCRFASNPGPQHWTGLKRILRYLAHTKNFGIRYSSTSQPLHAYCDSDWANCQDTRRSTTGYCFIQAGGPVSWKSKLQKSIGSLPGVATSSVTAEYQALYDASREAAWLRQLYQGLGFPMTAPTVIHGDQQGA